MHICICDPPLRPQGEGLHGSNGGGHEITRLVPEPETAFLSVASPHLTPVLASRAHSAAAAWRAHALSRGFLTQKGTKDKTQQRVLCLQCAAFHLHHYTSGER